MTVTLIPEVMQDMADSAYRQQVYIVAETQMHVTPWLFEDEGWEKSRLKAAIELVCSGKVTEQPYGWNVAGSATPYQIPRATMQCPCKAALHGKSNVCKHRVAVELFTRVQQAYPQPTLGLPPVTAEERLAHGTLRDSTALATHHTPQEDRMPDDDYIPEPATDHAPTAILEPAVAPRTLTPVAPQVDDLEAALQVWTTQRAVVQRFLKQELRPNVDYYTIKIGGKESKPSLSKAGAEKVMGWLKIQASFTPDTGTWEMLGRPADLVAYVCTLRTRSGEIVGEGRGARSIKKDNGDINKAIKMAEKSACVSAVLRTGALSDVFTCDLEDLDEKESAPAKPAQPSSADLRMRIWKLIQARAPEVTSREEAEAWVQEHTGLALHPDQYRRILETLEGR